ncbi:hypothetical protein NMY22_g11928 [Coprinellus aureogranulatus]|nr:hypothetical protein NMY22_g11928 [Coprinellus aureogranulatus]
MFASTKLLLLSALGASAIQPPYIQVQNKSTYTPGLGDVKVPVQLGVMSACPDALLCESLFNDVLASAEGKVAGSLTGACVESMIPIRNLACGANMDRKSAPETYSNFVSKKYAGWPNWWEFVQCQNAQGKSEIGKSEVALKCAEAAHIDWESSGVGECAGLDGSGTGDEGIDLLKQSLQYGQALGITKSCTILINERKVCVHDATWKECEAGHEVADFVKQIEDEYQRLNRDEEEYPESNA